MATKEMKVKSGSRKEVLTVYCCVCASKRSRGNSCILESRPHSLEHESLLRINLRCFLRRYAKECRIKVVNIFDEVAILGDTVQNLDVVSKSDGGRERTYLRISGISATICFPSHRRNLS